MRRALPCLFSIHHSEKPKGCTANHLAIAVFRYGPKRRAGHLQQVLEGSISLETRKKELGGRGGGEESALRHEHNQEYSRVSYFILLELRR